MEAATSLTASTIKLDDLTFRFVRIPPGECTMGWGEGIQFEKPLVRVRIEQAFDIGKTEVTVRQFRAFVEATGYVTDAEKERVGWIHPPGWGWHPLEGVNWRNPKYPQSDDHPVACVSWFDVTAFCRWLSKETGEPIRLPNEAEWEYACRAGTTTAYAGELDEVGWYRGNSKERTHPVAQKRPNAWGLYDMHGNVWEWCRAVVRKDGPATLSGDGYGLVIRGGSFINLREYLRSSFRILYGPAARNFNNGFRLVRAL